MKRIEIKKLSEKYDIRKLNFDDVEMIYTFCKSNTQYYEYCGKELSIELIERDLRITPPGIPSKVRCTSSNCLINILSLPSDVWRIE